MHKGLGNKATMETAQAALHLIGNPSASISKKRRAAIANMNNRLLDMAEDDHLFAKAAPNLFGDSFAKKAKEHDEELKCLNHASLQGRDHRKTGLGGRNQFFRTSHSSFQSWGSGANYSRGRGQGSGGFHCHHPYKVQDPTKKQTEIEDNRTHENSLSMVENTNILYVYPNLHLVMSINLFFSPSITAPQLERKGD